MRLRGRLLITAVAGVTALGTAGVARASDEGGGGRQVIQAEDDCDPATFNAAIGAGTCVGDGETTFPQFIAQLQRLKRAPEWRFDPSRTHVAPGNSLLVENDGGEAHTFTPVKAFGGGCIDQLNAILGLTPVPECGNPQLFGATLVLPDHQLPVNGLTPGVHKFQCLIHPWMHAVVTVRAGGGHEGHDG